jgi:chromosome segregation ATPase
VGGYAPGPRRENKKMLWFSQKREIEELQRRVDKLESVSKTLDLEWSSTYDKFRSILARIAKRQERVDAASAEQDVSAPGSQEPGQGRIESALPGSSLDPRRSALNQQILARRARMMRPQ